MGVAGPLIAGVTLIGALVGGAAVSSAVDPSPGEIAPVASRAIDEVGAIDFARDVRPILSNTCFKCHGPDPKTREAGVRLDTLEGLTRAPDDGEAPVVPGHRAASLLWQKVSAHDEGDVMPPSDSGLELSPEQIETLGRWIDAGAPWQPHWSFAPVLRPPLPDVSDPDWCRNDLDRFVLARLDSEGLAPSARADRQTLIRRVSLDLTGLPPTLDEVEAFLADESADAYGRVVDRLLASERFGERWARVWLDLARYADSKGYEKDAGRTIWPYRDWVIRAFNADMPFDEFTVRQLAGDLLDAPTEDDVLATAFHRNTMTNDEGGTDDEEFRVAAVKDRVNTTMSVWNGLTAACAECHTHKYDPLTQTEYYRLYAFFNQTQDADRNNEEPTRPIGSAEQRRRLSEIAETVAALEREIDSIVGAASADAGAGAADPVVWDEPRDVYWIDDDSPAGAIRVAERGPARWQWVSSDEHPSASGSRSLVRASGDFTQAFAHAAPIPLTLHEGDRLVMHVWIEESDPAREIMLQIHTVRGGWLHRAYWGENLIEFGADGTTERRHMGDLPGVGSWTRLEIALEDIGLVAGDQINGWAFSQHGGTVRWDAAGVVTRHAPDERWRTDQGAWESVLAATDGRELPAAVRDALLAEARTEEQSVALRDHYLRHFHAGTRELTRGLVEQLERLGAERQSVSAMMTRVPIMAELAPDMRRKTHLFEAGSFLSPAEEVTPGVPEVLPAIAADAPANRLGLARWLVDPEHPLTARVTVNRFWERFFGQGLVETVEDFGSQGMLPTHPELLDWLALEFVERGWSVKELCRLIVTSSTYTQSSDVTPELLERDRFNRLVARGPRFRLEAEMVRDQALAVSGLLSPKMYGSPVFPPQPEGVWQIVYSGARWHTSTGQDRYRRGLYTYWRRTSPYPSMTTFDAPSREVCTPRRLRTNTPLQALVTLNDPVYVEASQALARRMIREGGPIASDRAAAGFRMCLARQPSEREVDAILDLVADEYARFSASETDAVSMSTDPLGPLPEGVSAAEAAAWTVAANVLLNLDEFLTRK